MLMRRNVPVVLALLLAIALVYCAGCKQPSTEQPQPTTPATTAAPTMAPAEATQPEQKAPTPTPAKPETKPAAEKPAAEAKPEGKTVTTPSGLKYIDVKVGSGPVAKAGQVVTVHYTGWLVDGGKKFDSSRDHGQPFDFPLGGHQVIPGWDEGVVGMKVGGRRTLIIPSKLGYGEHGAPPDIPPNAALKFDVELLGVK